MTSQVGSLLKVRDFAYRSGDTALHSTVKADLKRGLRTAKIDYKGKIESHLASNRRCDRTYRTSQASEDVMQRQET